MRTLLIYKMDKFNRNYSLTVQAQSGENITVTLPFTVEFDITRNTLSSANTSTIRIYNLGETTRNKIRYNMFDPDDYREIELKAGYGDNLPTIFKGNIQVAYSVRQGVDFITTIEAFDAGFAFVNAKTNTQFRSGTANKDVIENLISDLSPYGVTRGAVGDFSGELSRGATYSGNTIEIINNLSGNAAFIDKQKIYVLKNGEYVDGAISVISSDSGLLGTPVLQDTYLNLEVIFEPMLQVGQQIELKTTTAANYSGFYKITSLKHKATISEAVCGNAVTSVGMFAPNAFVRAS